MDEFVSTLFCFTIVLFVVIVGIAIYAIKTLEKSQSFMDFSDGIISDNLLERINQKLLEREYQRGRKDASDEYEEVLKDYERDDIPSNYKCKAECTE